MFTQIRSRSQVLGRSGNCKKSRSAWPRNADDEEGTLRPIRLFLADDHGLVLQAIHLALEPHSEIEIVGETRAGSEVLPRVAETRPDIVMLDVRMPVLDGLQVLDRLQEQYPETKVVMLSGVDEPELAAEALRRGAKAFVGKAIDPAELAPILCQIIDGTLAVNRLQTEPSPQSVPRTSSGSLPGSVRSWDTSPPAGRTSRSPVSCGSASRRSSTT